MTYAFIDTNLLLHFKVFEGIKWTKLLNDKDVVLVICPTVLDEIDKHKDSAKGKIRNRAKTIYKILSDYLDGKTTNNIDLIFCESGKVNTVTSTYSNGREDEYIIAAASAFSKEGCKVIVSFDIGMKFRAKQAGIDFMMPEDTPENRLSQEPTEEEKKIKELEKEVLLYKNRRSKPILTFRDGTDAIEISQYVAPDFSLNLQKYREKLVNDNQPFVYRRPRIADYLPEEQVRQIVCPYTDEQIEEYNNRITPYIDRLVQLKNIKLHTTVIDGYVFELKFTVSNKGTEPTGKMCLQIDYPDGIVVVDKYSYCEVDLTPPEKPILQTNQEKQFAELAKQTLAIQSYDFVNHRFYSDNNKVCENHWHTRKTTVNSTVLELPSLNHNLNVPIEIPNSIFVFACEKGDFIIRWTISDESNIEPIAGELTLRVK
ncbi:PIN domain-containing protein [Bacteroides caecimuris]|uniref:PIN domain-containing protein n=1 Tax=Bacteroides caecimuris TaxID=1796613 RepID=UPI00264A1D8E|nr:PIN domain-containing protein [Bacteroides caecimuris]